MGGRFKSLSSDFGYKLVGVFSRNTVYKRNTVLNRSSKMILSWMLLFTKGRNH